MWGDVPETPERDTSSTDQQVFVTTNAGETCVAIATNKTVTVYIRTETGLMGELRCVGRRVWGGRVKRLEFMRRDKLMVFEGDRVHFVHL